MNLSILTRDKTLCDSCENEKLKNFFQITSLPFKTVNNYEYKKNETKSYKKFKLKYCSNCKIISLTNLIRFNNLYKNFRNFRLHSKFMMQEVKKEISKNKKITILNVGKSNNLINAKDLKKINYIKLDPSVLKEDKINKKFSSIKKFSINYKSKIDLIIIENFLSNLPNINQMITIFNNLIKENGKIMIYTHYGINNLKKVDINRFYHEHIHYFSLKSLLILFKKQNLYQSKIKFLENNDFLYVIFNKKQNHICRDVRKVIDKENAISKTTFNHFKEILKKNKIKLDNLIKKNYNFYGYGCSIGAISIIRNYDLDKKILKIIDDKPLSKKIFLNNNEINIYKINNIKFEKKKKIILNLIPRYNDIVIKKIKKYMNRGDLYINLIKNFEIKKF
tara:strand:- start:386 stop:1561 length:1176 start_codon:yes stop_codon:yes gene_type:complete